MKTQIYPPPGQQPAPPSGFKLPSTALIIGALVVAAAIAYLIISTKKKNEKEKTYSGN